MERMLTLDESKRITLEEIVTHPWLKIYFPEENAPKITSLPSQSNNKDKNKDNNNDKNKSEDKDKIKINKKTKGNHMELLKSPGCMQKHQMSLPKSPSFSQSAYSISNTELSATYSQINHGGAALNIMLPQQAVSRSSITSPQQNPYSIIPQTRTSRVRSKSRTRTRTRTRTNSGYNHSPLPTSPHSIPRKASTSYGYKSPNNNRRSIGYKSPLSPPINNNNNNNNTPTPIIESHTSKHDYKQYFAQVVDDEESLKKLRNGKSHKNKKKKQRYNNNNQQIKLENEKEKEKKKNGKKFFKLSSLSIFGSSKKK